MATTPPPAATLTRHQALAVRLRSLLLVAPTPGPLRQAWDDARASVGSVVTWFGAMQAQDLASGLWSLGARLPDLTRTQVVEALERREALRTWPMRGTVHLVPSRDAAWMVRILGERPLAGAVRRRETIGLTTADAERAVELLTEALQGGRRLTRSRCLEVLQDGGLALSGNHGYHLLWYASQRGVTCIAPNEGKEQTFALLHEWAPDQAEPERDEALGLIATRYVRSHGPVPRSDLVGWLGVTAGDVRRGLEVAGDAVVTVDVEGTPMLVSPEALEAAGALPATAPRGRGLVALPGFDEYLLGYKDRSLMVDEAHKQAIIPGGNGIFQSTLSREGRVVAIWKRSTGRAKTVVDVTPLSDWSAADTRAAERAFEPYARYLDAPVEIRVPEAG